MKEVNSIPDILEAFSVLRKFREVFLAEDPDRLYFIEEAEAVFTSESRYFLRAHRGLTREEMKKVFSKNRNLFGFPWEAPIKLGRLSGLSRGGMADEVYDEQTPLVITRSSPWVELTQEEMFGARADWGWREEENFFKKYLGGDQM